MSSSVNRTTSYPSVVAGADVEGAVIVAVDELEPVSDSEARWFDARATDLIVPSERLPFGGICLVESGTEIEIKACQHETSNGGDERVSGRYYIRAGQHGRLVDAGAMYLFAVYAPNPPRTVLGMCLVPASLVDELLRGKWYDVDGDRCERRVAKLPWTSLPITFGPRRSTA